MKNTFKYFIELDRRLVDAKERLELSATPESEICISNIKFNLAVQALLAASSGIASSVNVDKRKADALTKVEVYERAVERLIKKHSE